MVKDIRSNLKIALQAKNGCLHGKVVDSSCSLTTKKANCYFANDPVFFSKRLAGLLGSCVTQVCIITFLKVNLSPG